MFGDIKTLKIDVAGGDFTTPLLTASEFGSENVSMPSTTKKRSPLLDGTPTPTGEETKASIAALGLSAAEVTAVNDNSFARTRMDVQIVSGDGGTTQVTRNVLPMITTNAIVEAGKYGYAMIEFEAHVSGNQATTSVTTT